MTLKFSNARKNARFNAGVLRWGCLLLLAFFLIPCAPAAPLVATPKGGGLLALGLIGAVMPMKFMDREGREGGAEFSEDDLADMSEGKFRATVMGGVKSVADKMADLKKQVDGDVGGWQKENKKAVEELTTLKNSVKDVEEITKGLKKVLDARQREYHLATASLSPVRRIQADPQKRAAFNLLVRAACNRGSDLDGAIEILGKDLDGGTSPGSTVLTTGLLPEMYDVLGTSGIWNTLGVVRLGKRSVNMPVKTARALATWMDEAAAIGHDATKAGTSIPISVKKAGVLLLVSRELLLDAEYDVTADVLDEFGEAMDYRFDFAFFCGDGTADNLNGGFTGVFNAGTAAVAAAGNTRVEDLDFEDYVNCLSTVAPVVLSRRARWWMHPTQIARTLCVRDENGRPIFLTGMEAPTYGGIGSVLGYPVTPGHALPSANVAGSKVAAFGDPQGYKVGIREDLEIATSDHYAFDSDERAFRGLARAAGKIRRAAAMAVLTLPGA